MTNTKAQHTPVQIFDIEWFERDCLYNVEAKVSNGKLIVDAYVVINGERRAILSSRGARERGYQLYDIDYRPLVLNNEAWRREYRNNPSPVATKGEIGEFISQAIADGIIPTISQITNLRNQEAINKANKEAADKEERRLRIIRDAAPDMKGELEEDLWLFRNLLAQTNKEEIRKQITERIIALEAAIAKATKGE